MVGISALERERLFLASASEAAIPGVIKSLSCCGVVRFFCLVMLVGHVGDPLFRIPPCGNRPNLLRFVLPSDLLAVVEVQVQQS